MSGALETWTALWWTWIAPLSVQAAVLIPAAALVDRLLPRRTWPQLRAGIWWVVLLRLLLPPGWPRIGGLPWPEALASALPSGLPRLPFLDPSPLEAATLESGARSEILPWATATFLAWACGLMAIGLFSTRAAYLQRRRWRKDRLAQLPARLRSSSLEAAALLGLRRVPPIVAGPHVPSPCVLGVLRPTVYLPASFAERVKRGHVHHVLLHELAHVRRWDTRAAALGSLIRAVYWFHPFVWWAVARLHRLREPCCDRTVARALGDGTTAYRRTLMLFATGQLVADVPAPRSPATGLGFLRPESLLITRLRLLEHSLERTWLRRATTTAVLLGLFACSLPLARSADLAVSAVGDVIERPPGCLPLRYLVLRRLAQEQAGRTSSETEAGPPETSGAP